MRRFLVTTFFLTFLFAGNALAIRPLTTDDVSILPSYKYLFEYGGRYRDFGKKNIHHINEIFLGKTFFERYEFTARLPYEGRLESSQKTWALGEIGLSLKWKWLGEKKSVPGVGFKLGLKLPTGQEHDTPPIGTGTTDVLLDLILQKSVPWITLYGNAGYTARTGSGKQDRIRAGFGSRYPLSEKTDIFAEWTGTTSTQPAQRDDTLDFYLGVGHQTRWDWRWDLGSTFGFTTATPDWSVRWGMASEF